MTGKGLTSNFGTGSGVVNFPSPWHVAADFANPLCYPARSRPTSAIMGLSCSANSFGGHVSHPTGITDLVQAGDTESLRAALAQDPSLASVRDRSGVSAIMFALYQNRKDILELLLAAAPALDIFEASSTGRRERVDE